MAKIISKTRKKASSASRSRAQSKPAAVTAKRIAKQPRPASKPAAKPAPRQKKLTIEQSRSLAREIAQLALTKKAFDVVIMDVREVSSVTDFFVVCSGATDIQVRAIGRAIDDGLRAKGIKPLHSEGEGSCTWLLLDYVDVVVHVMQPRVRDYYNLEGLWADAPREEVAD
ncbi:MAG TPA: ribosome silencing factor [Candidatus Edwardsbacteria bacterium]|nr:ribosome silencing factor [Candidatus Edwardsbacteria bacterium]